MFNMIHLAVLSITSRGREKQFYETAQNLWKNEYRYESFDYVYSNLKSGVAPDAVGAK